MILGNGLIYMIVALILALIAVFLAFDVTKRTSGRLFTCWKFLLSAIIVFALNRIINILNYSLQIIQIGIAVKVLDIVFIILLIVGFWNMQGCVKELNGEIRADKKI